MSPKNNPKKCKLCEWLNTWLVKRSAIVVLAIITVGFSLVQLYLSKQLRTEVAPLGLLSLELAFNQETINTILASWGGKLSVAKWQIGFDFGFLVCYWLLLTRLCCSARIKSHLGIWAISIATVFDILENIGLFLVLSEVGIPFLPLAIGLLAIFKFLLAGLCFYLIIGSWINMRLCFRQFSHFRFLLLFGLLVLLTPLSAIAPRNNPFNRMLGGLFVDLNGWQEFTGTLIATLLIFAILIAQALIIDGILARYGIPDSKGQHQRFRADDIFDWDEDGRPKIGAGRKADNNTAKQLDEVLPRWLDEAFGFPLGKGQTLAALILILPWAVVTIVNAKNSWHINLIACFIGCLVAIILIVAAGYLFKFRNSQPKVKTVLTKKPHLFALASLSESRKPIKSNTNR